MTYMLLSGSPPFDGANELEIIKSVKQCNLNVNSPELKHISDEAKNFILLTLHETPSERLSADQALQHKWIKLYDPSEHDMEVTR